VVDGGGDGGEAIESVQLYDIHMCLQKSPSNVMCNGVNEIQIPSYLLALPQHYKGF
jgi:hypothetical protein